MMNDDDWSQMDMVMKHKMSVILYQKASSEVSE